MAEADEGNRVHQIALRQTGQNGCPNTASHPKPIATEGVPGRLTEAKTIHERRLGNSGSHADQAGFQARLRDREPATARQPLVRQTRVTAKVK